jgi:DNA-damage-inducible protein J
MTTMSARCAPNARVKAKGRVKIHELEGSVVRARIDAGVKRQAARALEDAGLSLSDAIRMMLTRVAVEKALPFEVRVPNAATARALRNADRGVGLTRSRNARELFAKLGI